MKIKIISHGNESNPAMVFLHGWPDTPKLWEHQVNEFSKDYFCICPTLPQYEDPAVSSWGLDFPDLTKAIVDVVQTDFPSTKQGVILVGHDWGAFLSYLIERDYPEFVQRFVTMDIGGHFKPKGFRVKLFVLAYQLFLVFAFLLSLLPQPIRFIGDFFSRKFAAYAKAPNPSLVHGGMNYPYFYMWRAILIKKYRSALLLKYRPEKPLLYMYGTRKPFQFHSRGWIKGLEENPHQESFAVKGGEHWFMRNLPEITNAKIRQWLESSSA